MGFEFGSIDNLEPKTALLCFLGVILFVIVMDFLLGVIEHMASENVLYNQMFRVMYKELMMMGIVSFLIVMYEAIIGSKAEEPKIHENLISIDFSHILLFYTTIFFVVHCVHLIRISFLYAGKYRKYFCEKLDNLIEETRDYQNHWLWGTLFRARYIPLSGLRNRVEFKILHVLFDSHYYLPEDFNFAAYLSGCLARFALKTINRSFATWIVLAILLVLNYARMETGWTCKVAGAEGTSHHRFLGQVTTEHNCRKHSANYFLGAGFLLMVYVFILLLISRWYKLRLIAHSGVESASDYLEFLNYAEKAEEEENNHYGMSYRYEEIDLKEVLERAIDALEEEEDEEGHKTAAHLMRRFYKFCRERYAKFRVKARVWATQLLCPHRLHLQQMVLAKEEAEREKDVELARVSISDDPEDDNEASDAGEVFSSGHKGKEDKHHDNEHNMRVSLMKILSVKEAVRDAFDPMMLTRETSSSMDGISLHNMSPNKHKNLAARDELMADSSKSGKKEGLSVGLPAKRMSLSSKLPPAVSPRAINKSASLKLSEPGKSASSDSGGATPRSLTPTPAPFDRQTSVQSDLLKLSKYWLVGFHRHKKAKHGIKQISEWEHWMEEKLFGRKPPPPKPAHRQLSPMEEAAFAVFAEKDFDSIYLFGKPILFFRAVEMGIMFNCLYMALWITNYITVVEETGYDETWNVLMQLAMLIPFIYFFMMFPYIAETCSLLTAIAECNPDVVLKVVNDALETDQIVEETRTRLVHKIFKKDDHRELEEKKRVLDQLFDEIDADGSGFIDQDEFRQLLRQLKVKTGHHRFKLLFRHLDGLDGNGMISREEFVEFVFPSSKSELMKAEREMHRAQHDLIKAREELARAEKEIHKAEHDLKEAEVHAGMDKEHDYDLGIIQQAHQDLKDMKEEKSFQRRQSSQLQEMLDADMERAHNIAMVETSRKHDKESKESEIYDRV